MDAELIVPANGATEVISMLCRQALGPMLTSVPTFGRWTNIPREVGLPLHTMERTKGAAFQLDVEQIARRVRRFARGRSRFPIPTIPRVRRSPSAK